MQGQTTSTAESGDLGEMQTKAIDKINEARGTIEEFARENPRAAVGIAVGVGFILGGGLTPRILFGLGALVARRMARDYVRSQLSSAASGVLRDVAG